MADRQLTFDGKKVKIVPIEQVRPNEWNPKVHNDAGPDFIKVVASVRENGLRQPIVVRSVEPDPQSDYPEAIFEIIDGEQRWRAATSLGYPKVVVYDEGQVPDERAQALTIWYQQQVPFDEIMESRLASALAEIEGLVLPYTEAELDHLQKLANFDFDDLGGDDDEGEDGVEHRSLSFRFSLIQFEVVKSALEAAQEDGSPSDAKTLETWARDYLADRGGAPE